VIQLRVWGPNDHRISTNAFSLETLLLVLSMTASQLEALRDEIGGINLPLEMTLHLLGLRGVADSIVGNAAVRGVSGGERHRVTTAEMVSGKHTIHCRVRLKF